MEKPLDLDVTKSGSKDISLAYFSQRKASIESDSEEVSYKLALEVDKNFFKYLKKFNLAEDKYILVLPSANHYFYDKRELKKVRTFLSLRKLNLMTDIDLFLNTLFDMLSVNANFLGYFSDSNTDLKRKGFLSGLSTRIINLLDMKLVHYVNKNTVSQLLEKHGFKLVDMIEIDELTYFYAQKVCHS